VAYNEGVEEFVGLLDGVERDTTDLEARLLIHSIRNSFFSHYDECNAAIRRKIQGGDRYHESFITAERISHYLGMYLSQLLDLTLERGNAEYAEELVSSRRMRTYTIFALAGFILASLSVGILIADRITKPLELLTRRSREMAAGDLAGGEIPLSSKDEIGELARCFNVMSGNIQRLVEDLREKSKLEKKLHREELRYLRMKHTLDETRFKALQAQINPHFFFNTLNTISRIVLLREAKDAVPLIEALSRLLRYSLDKGSEIVSLRDEIEVVEKYAFIQRYRFEDRIGIAVECGIERPESIPMPGFTLQPLVENAIIHGLEPKPGGGSIRLTVTRQEGKVLVRIADDGLGIPEEKLAVIRAMKDERKDGKAPAIGISNVARRLEICYGTRHCLSIASTPGRGTVVTIRIPVKEDAPCTPS